MILDRDLFIEQLKMAQEGFTQSQLLQNKLDLLPPTISFTWDFVEISPDNTRDGFIIAVAFILSNLENGDLMTQEGSIEYVEKEFYISDNENGTLAESKVALEKGNTYYLHRRRKQ